MRSSVASAARSLASATMWSCARRAAATHFICLRRCSWTASAPGPRSITSRRSAAKGTCATPGRKRSSRNEIVTRGFLPGEDASWIEAERRTLRDIELQALEAICDAELAQGRASDAERVARRLIVADGLRESGYRLLMRALAASGNRAQAATVMDECRKALAEVGARPSPEAERALRTALATA